MQHKSNLPVILQDCALDGTYNTLDIGSLAECLTWIRNNTRSYYEYFSSQSQQENTCLIKAKPLPRKMTKIHKYLSQLPVDNKDTVYRHNHSFLGSEIHVTLIRLDETMFLIEFYFADLN